MMLYASGSLSSPRESSLPKRANIIRVAGASGTQNDPYRLVLSGPVPAGDVPDSSLTTQSLPTRSGQYFQELLSSYTSFGSAGLAGDVLDFPSLTTEPQLPERLERNLRALFEAASDEVFESGMDSAFSRELESLVRKYGNGIFRTLASLIISESANSNVASAAAQRLGEIDDPATYRSRLWLLERALQSSSSWIRDGAILGLASLDDPSAIPYVEKAIEKERNEELRQSMVQVLDQLKATQRQRG